MVGEEEEESQAGYGSSEDVVDESLFNPTPMMKEMLEEKRNFYFSSDDEKKRNHFMDLLNWILTLQRVGNNNVYFRLNIFYDSTTTINHTDVQNGTNDIKVVPQNSSNSNVTGMFSAKELQAETSELDRVPNNTSESDIDIKLKPSELFKHYTAYIKGRPYQY